MTIPGQEWLDSLPNMRKHEPCDVILGGLIEQLMNAGRRTISIAELNLKKRIVFDSEIAGFVAMGTRQVTTHVKLTSVLQTARKQIRRSFSPVWMETALRKLHKKAVDMDTNEPTQEFTPQQHKGWSGYRDMLITATESHGSRKTAHCGLAIQYRCVATNTEKTSCSG